ncbi:DUF2218 domain-containing protein [Franzmannia qiaohouensis]|uniref:DUF2218 domain-containing protein n=1 Tax=Franzmannia qiaohouensis TaxID=1329370 RepID=A0ABU1H8A0_9GAMM|nr:DUF2218 domain-containing protein [Halomonas qiaohouensis]MDR5903691.1 DUF2218 domain-containing protein [Halomonas qiaohouensis]
MPISRTEIATADGSKLINRLCKHWAHKLEVEHDAEQGRVAFADGTCLMHATADRLTVAIEALDEPTLDHLEGVVSSHLDRMAGEPLDIVWEN